MFKIRKASERGIFNHGWLKTAHTFSFADYHDPEQMGFRSLRVINEDRVAPGKGFGTHGHRDMEIISYVLEGSLQHKDSMGNGAVLRSGEFQRISAGSGILHSEFNPSTSEPAHFYQIWLLPRSRGVTPSYEQKAFAREGVKLVASPDGREGSLTIHQDARIYLVHGENDVSVPLAPGRHAWVQVLRGTLDAGGQTLEAGDGLAVSGEAELALTNRKHSEVMVFDLA